MRNRRASEWLLTFVLCLLISLMRIEFAQSAPAPFKKVMIVVFENSDYQTAINDPNFSQFARGGALLSNFQAETHPSQGNYLAMVGGDTFGVNHDGIVNFNLPHIGDLLEARGLNWKIYLEGYPGSCFQGLGAGDYARKHNPFISFTNVSQNPTRCLSHVVNASELVADFKNGTVPAFSIYVPNLKDDGHDTSVTYAGQWFSAAFGPVVKNPVLMQELLLVATFDESHNRTDNHIYTAFFGPGVIPGSVVNSPQNHFSLLTTIEVGLGLGLGNLGRFDARSQPIVGIWK